MTGRRRSAYRKALREDTRILPIDYPDNLHRAIQGVNIESRLTTESGATRGTS